MQCVLYLVVSPGKVGELFPGELVDPLDDLGQVLLERRVVEHDLELSELLVGDLALPLDVALAIDDHRPADMWVIIKFNLQLTSTISVT